MDIPTSVLARAETIQYVAFGGGVLLLSWAETVRPARRQEASRAERWRTNFALTTLNVLALGVLPVSFIGAAQWAESRELGLLHALPLALSGWLTLLGRGFISWITHLLMHKVPLLWRVHRVHHTDTELDVSTTVRFHPFELPIGLAIGLPFVLCMGLSPWVLAVYEVLDVVVTLVSHANVSLPSAVERALRYLVVTPALHKVHHSTRAEETDSNFGAVFPIWDVVFGTFRINTHEPPLKMPLGLAEARGEATRSLWWLLGVPFRGSIASPNGEAPQRAGGAAA